MFRFLGKKCWLAVAVVWAVGGTVHAEDVNWVTSVDKAWTTTVQQQRPLLVFFTTTQCRYCKQMLAQTFTDAQIASDVNANFVPVLVDADVEDKLAKQLNVSVYPTTVIISPQAAVLQRVQGFASTKQLQDKLIEVKRVAKAGGTSPK